MHVYSLFCICVFKQLCMLLEIDGSLKYIHYSGYECPPQLSFRGLFVNPMRIF
jgi:hypothetical protein